MPPPGTLQDPVSAGRAAIALIASPPLAVRSSATPVRIATAFFLVIKSAKSLISFAGTP